MGYDALHQPFRKTAPSKFFLNEYVCKIAESRSIGDHAREPSLLVTAIETEAHRIADGAFHHRQWHSVGPVRRSEKGMHSCYVHARPIRADLKLASPPGGNHQRCFS